jgi:hypothetical protein
MKPLPLPAGGFAGTILALALVLAAAPASGQPRSDAPASREALVKGCDAQAAARKLLGAARGAFMSECLAGSPAEAPGARPVGRDDAQNLQRKEAQDAQFRKWNSAAGRAIKSICAGCSQGPAAGPAPARPRKPKARPRPPPDDDDGATAGGPLDDAD